ncbi:hypothetical protein SAMN06269117_12921 [Balnearium lithotrophicum]|uniref:Integrase catalytic domain-containing protein n=1 Tax=Balnearium lithotrophicum TaxID=223788 RepID=A0A521DZW2_9BACT|nr:hypothetical protein SAMN06269117_12921 [Balnearium lithotrophicum]
MLEFKSYFRVSTFFLNFNTSTVCRWLKETEKENREPKLLQYIRKLEETGLYEKLLELLLYKVKEKGEERYLPLAKVYHALQLELEMNGISVGYHRFRQIVKAIVVGVLGKNWEEFAHKRRSRGRAQRISFGAVARPKEVLEIDLTGYEFEGKNYSLILGFDLYTGFLFPPFIVENKEKGGVGSYNKAFNSMEVALYLIDVFKKAGIPKVVKCDNEKILKSQLIKEGLSRLGVRLSNTYPYRPNQKIIEVVIKEFKSFMRLHRRSAESIEELAQLAVESYNRNHHRFKHLSEKVIPAELFKGYSRKADETLISTAFVETVERTLKDGQIQIDNLIYQINYPKKKEKVVVKRLITNLKEVMVYQKSSGEFIGVAKLFSKPPVEVETTVEFKQEKLRSKRIDRRKKKLEEEHARLSYMEKPAVSLEEIADGEPQISISIEELESLNPEQERTEESQPRGLTLEDL